MDVCGFLFLGSFGEEREGTRASQAHGRFFLGCVLAGGFNKEEAINMGLIAYRIPANFQTRTWIVSLCFPCSTVVGVCVS